MNKLLLPTGNCKEGPPSKLPLAAGDDNSVVAGVEASEGATAAVLKPSRRRFEAGRGGANGSCVVGREG